MGSVLGLGGGSPGSGAIDGEDNFSFQEAGALVDVGANWYSIANAAAATGAVASGGNFTVGGQFQISRALSCTGIKFYWKSVGGARTIRCKLWQGGVAVGSVDFPVNASGVYTAPFLLPVALTPYIFFFATIWDTSGGNYINSIATGSQKSGVSIMPFCYAQLFTLFSSSAGDHIPNNSSPNELYPVEPVFAAFPLG